MDFLTSVGIIKERINLYLQKELKNEYISVNCNHVWVLSLIYLNDNKIEIKELIKRLEKKKSTVTEIINTLEKNGLVKRYQSIDDKRIYYVETTEKGNSIKESIMNIMTDIENVIFKGFDEEEKQILTKLINRVVINFDEVN